MLELGEITIWGSKTALKPRSLSTVQRSTVERYRKWEQGTIQPIWSKELEDAKFEEESSRAFTRELTRSM